MTLLQVTSRHFAYGVLVQEGSLLQLGTLVQEHCTAQRALLVMDEAVAETHGPVAAESLLAAGLQVSRTTLTAKESHKRVDAVTGLWATAMDAGLDRSDVIIALGGGLTGDVAGFAAATWLRGIALIQVPTTLLAMVDASIGGKTGVNVPLPDAIGGGLGKNMAGAFWPPRLVVSDPTVLRTLPVRELRCGLAECVKHGLLSSSATSDTGLLNQLATIGPAVAASGVDGLGDVAALIRTAAAFKVEVVSGDERETGRRALLNLGHTFAHAIEGRPGLDLKHGEAVSIGLIAAAHVGQQLGLFDDAATKHLRQLLLSLQLPLVLPTQVSAQELLDRMQFDKKTLQGVLHLIVPLTGGGAEIRNDVDASSVLSAWHQVGAS
jgi:3-dehydroquinate synthase